MKLLLVVFVSLSVSAWSGLHGGTGAAKAPGQTGDSPQGWQPINISRSGSRQASKGPEEHFTGPAEIERLFPVHDPSRVLGSSVTFQAGARTAWHKHVLGQILIVVEGTGRIQQWGGPVQEIRKGDVVWTPPGVKHWHGATPNSAMTHIAIQEQLDGKVVDWMEKVSEEEYHQL
jgi:quercetin dioxygenase-like cupin family protein